MSSEQKSITLLIGNGLWLSIVNKENMGNEVLLSLPEIFKRYFEQNSESVLQKYFPEFDEESFGYVDILCDLYEKINISNENSIFPNKSEMKKILNEKDDLLKFSIEKIREACNLIKSKKTYKNLIKQLEKLIDDNRVSIATLNYDQLLYNLIFKKGCDGFVKNNNGQDLKFKKEHFIKLLPLRNSYLHLHGSFLFEEKNDEIYKRSIRNVQDNTNPLIILTSNNNKYQKIKNNADENFILNAYNQVFIDSLQNGNVLLTIIGYGFNDKYINNNIGYSLAKNPNLNVNIIKWKEQNQMEFIESLKKEFNGRIYEKTLDNICDVSVGDLSGDYINT